MASSLSPARTALARALGAAVRLAATTEASATVSRAVAEGDAPVDAVFLLAGAVAALGGVGDLAGAEPLDTVDWALDLAAVTFGDVLEADFLTAGFFP